MPAERRRDLSADELEVLAACKKMRRHPVLTLEFWRCYKASRKTSKLALPAVKKFVEVCGPSTSQAMGNRIA